jgi:2-dehydro-3-deoxyphosphooctonate aldolase (KDO 8-P synthase)
MSGNAIVSAGSVRFGNTLPLALIAGPCQMESRDHALEMALALKEISANLGIGLVFKASFDKANRTSGKGQRGMGLKAALPVFAEIRERTGLPTLTDVHEATQCVPVAEVVDVLQIPAFLCRQTDLLIAAAKTGRVVNVKKGQFLAPWDMANVAAKITEAGNPNVMVTERGASFGYNALVSDMRSLPIMAETTGAPVIFDATHSVQQPGGKVKPAAASANLLPFWPARRWRLALPVFSSRPTQTRTMRRPMAPIWCICGTSMRWLHSLWPLICWQSRSKLLDERNRIGPA